jgi:CYTH domain-containing protein
MENETERKFVCDGPPSEVPELEIRIQQAYLMQPANETVHPELRIRKSIGTGFSENYEDFNDRSLDLKLGHPPSRVEISKELSEPEFQRLWQISGRRFEKSRHVYQKEGLELEYDRIQIGSERVLWLLEIEFPEDKELEEFFDPSELPAIEAEVTGDPFYNNYQIAERAI